MDMADVGVAMRPAPGVIRTDRLVLRTYRPGDHRDLLTFYGRSDVCRYLLNEPWSLAEAREAVQTRMSRRDLASGAVALVVEFGGRGFATEAVTALIDLAFATPRLRRVVARMDSRNESSARLAQRIGMRREGHFRQNAWIKNEWTDTVVFATLRGEWPSVA